MKKQKVVKQTNVVMGQKQSTHEQLVKALENYEKSKVDVAVAFYNAYEKKEDNGAYCWQNMGYTTFREYVEKEFGFEYRNAMYYVKIGKTIVTLGITKEDLEEIGWSKFKILTNVFLSDMDKQTFEATKKKVKDMTVRELVEFCEKYELKEVKENESEKVRTCKMTFSLTEEQIEIVKKALDKAMDKYGIANENLALEAICAEFISGD